MTRAASRSDDERFLGLAIAEARVAAEHGDVPIGAVVVIDGEVVARRHNERERAGDPTAHAELLALRDAARVGDDGWRLTDATVYVTLEPCPMCAGGLVNARVARVVYGAADLKAGALASLYGIGSDPRLNHELEITGGVRAAECAELLISFFAGHRT
jgi:tRNA(adenine34) deaminase